MWRCLRRLRRRDSEPLRSKSSGDYVARTADGEREGSHGPFGVRPWTFRLGNHVSIRFDAEIEKLAVDLHSVEGHRNYKIVSRREAVFHLNDAAGHDRAG